MKEQNSYKHHLDDVQLYDIVLELDVQQIITLLRGVSNKQSNWWQAIKEMRNRGRMAINLKFYLFKSSDLIEPIENF